MKKLVLTLLLVSLLLVAVVGPASADEPVNASQACTAGLEAELESILSSLVGGPVDISHGACTSLLNTLINSEQSEANFHATAANLCTEFAPPTEREHCVQVVASILPVFFFGP